MSDTRRSPTWVLVLAVVVGAWLRLDQLLAQIPADDEWHALRAVAEYDFLWIFTHFGRTDHSIPMALYDELLSRTIGLEELGLRLPVLVAGLASIVVLPLLVRPLVGARVAHAFALLIACSPLLVYYSRYTRPYAPATLLAFTALVAVWRWRARPERRWMILHGTCAVAAIWLLPVFAPVVLAPLLLLLAEAALRRDEARPAWSVVLPWCACVAVGIALLLGPPLFVDSSSLTMKSGYRDTIGQPTLRQLGNLFFGVGEHGLRRGVLAVALVGALLLARRLPGFAAYVLGLLVVQVVALLVVNPVLIDSGITLARYVLVFQPFALLCLAVVLAEGDVLLGRLGVPERVPVVLLSGCVALFTVGPLPGVLQRPNNFTNHAWHQYFYDEPGRRGIAVLWGRHRKALPPFYAELAAEHAPGTLRVVEAPWLFPWTRVKQREAQAVHRQHVLIGFLGRGLNDDNELPLGDGFRFRSFVDVGDHDELVRREVDLVIFHNNLVRELKKHMSLDHILLGEHLAEYRERFGAPVYEDKRLTVFAIR